MVASRATRDQAHAEEIKVEVLADLDEFIRDIDRMAIPTLVRVCNGRDRLYSMLDDIESKIRRTREWGKLRSATEQWERKLYQRGIFNLAVPTLPKAEQLDAIEQISVLTRDWEPKLISFLEDSTRFIEYSLRYIDDVIDPLYCSYQKGGISDDQLSRLAFACAMLTERRNQKRQVVGAVQDSLLGFRRLRFLLRDNWDTWVKYIGEQAK